MPTPTPRGKPTKGQRISHTDGGKPEEHLRQPNHKRKADYPHHKSSARSTDVTYHGVYLAFYGSVLSNFNVGKKFRGSSAMSYLLPELDRLNIEHPPADSLAVSLMSDHDFTCGEQFLMACKGFLFELPTIPIAKDPPLEIDYIDQRAKQRRRIFLLNEEYDRDADEEIADLKARIEAERLLQRSNFMQVLRSRDPKEIKTLGRLTPDFNDAVWTSASLAVAVAASLARAEADPVLGDVYRQHWNVESNKPTHHFVEASPSDKVWGVGLGRQDSSIADPKKWKGQNRLGKAHDEASRLYNERRRSEKATES